MAWTLFLADDPVFKLGMRTQLKLDNLRSRSKPQSEELAQLRLTMNLKAWSPLARLTERRPGNNRIRGGVDFAYGN